MTGFTRHNRILAAVIGGIALILYGKTMAPTTTFWDCGEFIACSYTMGVAHPPGAPMFIMMGRVFTLIPFGDIGWRVNLISVLATAVIQGKVVELRAYCGQVFDVTPDRYNREVNEKPETRARELTDRIAAEAARLSLHIRAGSFEP